MKRDRKLLTFVVGFCLMFAAAAPSAGAAFEELGSFAGSGSGPGGSGSEDGQLANPNQAAVSDATGRLYVADTDNNRIQVFKPTASGGEYDSQAPHAAPTGLAIDQASGDVYVANASGVAKLDAGLSPVAGWTDPGVTGPLAVDPSSGDLLVADTGANLIRRFEADGTAAGSFAAERPISVAADSAGRVYVVTSSGDIVACASSSVRRFSGAGVEEATIGGSLEAPGSVAVDPDDDAIVIAARVNAYNCGSSAPLLAFFDAAGTETGQLTLAADTLYATVSGLVAQGGGSARSYAVTRSPMNDFFGATKITAVLETKPEAPTVSAQSAAPRTTEATLRATIDRGNVDTTYRFEYGPTAAYGQSTPASSVPAGKGDLQVSADLAGLQPGTTYHFRVVLENSAGSATGTDRVFTTAAAPDRGDACANAAIRAEQGSGYLADCRAYERVSPADKNGNDIWRGQAHASVTGDGLAFASAGAFGDA
ncbi:MAG TPA: hypothetical protein VFX85_08880, partial [Solirubrobacterales bacterium]|nr:hypothetical protein [Solirubrobacterales bacterium]